MENFPTFFLDLQAKQKQDRIIFFYFSLSLRIFILSILSIYVSVVVSSFFRWKQVISVSLTSNSSLHLLQVSNEGRNTAAKGPLCISLVRRVLWSTWSGLIMADFPSRYAMKRESLIGVWIVWNQERSGSSTLGKWILFKVSVCLIVSVSV